MTSKQYPLTTALVTGVGAIIGQGIIKSLRNSRYSVKIIGIDRSDQSPGPLLCDLFFKKPSCEENNQTYLNFWKYLIEEENVKIILPGIEDDVKFFDKNRMYFEQIGIPIVLNQSELITLLSDKWFLGEILLKNGLHRIPSSIPQTWSEAIKLLGPSPLLLKPRQGNGSKGIVLLNDEKDFNYWREKLGNSWMLQRIIGSVNEEYTVGIFGFGDGKSVAPITFKRLLSVAGNTLEAKVVTDSVIEQASVVLTEIFKPLGPTNYQFRKEDEIAYLLEINARFSSSNSIRTAFGYNEAEMSLDYFLYGEKPMNPNIRQGIAWRYSEDFVIYDSDTI